MDTVSEAVSSFCDEKDRRIPSLFPSLLPFLSLLPLPPHLFIKRVADGMQERFRPLNPSRECRLCWLSWLRVVFQNGCRHARRTEQESCHFALDPWSNKQEKKNEWDGDKQYAQMNTRKIEDCLVNSPSVELLFHWGINSDSWETNCWQNGGKIKL